MNSSKIFLSNFSTKIPLEAALWFIALVSLSFLDPEANSHFTICPIALMGFDWCPGCGLGRSISFLFHGEIKNSLTTHPLGIFAVLVLLSRIFDLTKKNIQSYGKSN